MSGAPKPAYQRIQPRYWVYLVAPGKDGPWSVVGESSGTEQRAEFTERTEQRSDFPYKPQDTYWRMVISRTKVQRWYGEEWKAYQDKQEAEAAAFRRVIQHHARQTPPQLKEA